MESNDEKKPMTKCAYADQYKAVRPPKCLDGKVCDVCREKWSKEWDNNILRPPLQPLRLYRRYDGTWC